MTYFECWLVCHRPSSWNHSNQWLLNSDSNQLNLVILGSRGLAEELSNEIRVSFNRRKYFKFYIGLIHNYHIIRVCCSLPSNLLAFTVDVAMISKKDWLGRLANELLVGAITVFKGQKLNKLNWKNF